MYSFGRSMWCFSKDEREAVQFMCLRLYYAGILQPYSKGNKPSTIEIVCQSLEAKFNCWYLKKPGQMFVTFQLEAFYIKRVCYLIIHILYPPLLYPPVDNPICRLHIYYGSFQ